jgi:hypothetical protein
MNLEALWDVTLTNQGAERSVLLYGVAHDSKGQFVGDGLTSVFILPQGLTIVNPPELEPIAYNSAPGYDEIIQRTGKVPAGVYTFCVYVVDAKNTRDTLGRDCISDHAVYNVAPIQLIHPNNASVVRESLPLFSWTSVSPLVPVEEVTYKLRIVEVFEHQSAFDALQSNPDWFIEDDIAPTLFPYPLSANALEDHATYAWQIIAYANTLDAGRGELVRSEASTFTVERKKSDSVSDSGIVIPSDTINPDLSHGDTLALRNVDVTSSRDKTNLPQGDVDSSHVHQVSQVDSTNRDMVALKQISDQPLDSPSTDDKTKKKDSIASLSYAYVALKKNSDAGYFVATGYLRFVYDNEYGPSKLRCSLVDDETQKPAIKEINLDAREGKNYFSIDLRRQAAIVDGRYYTLRVTDGGSEHLLAKFQVHRCGNCPDERKKDGQ